MHTSTKPNGIIRIGKKKIQNENGIKNKNLQQVEYALLLCNNLIDQAESQNCNPALPSSWRWFDKYWMHFKHKNTQQNQRKLPPYAPPTKLYSWAPSDEWGLLLDKKKKKKNINYLLIRQRKEWGRKSMILFWCKILILFKWWNQEKCLYHCWCFSWSTILITFYSENPLVERLFVEEERERRRCRLH